MTSSNVHILHSTNPPLAGYLRVGYAGYHKLEELHAADRLGFSRLVFDAAYALGQADVLRAQKAAGREIVIDLNVAETAMPSRFASAGAVVPPIAASPLFRGRKSGSGGMSVIDERRP